jgi:hypothetical protein
MPRRLILTAMAVVAIPRMTFLSVCAPRGVCDCDERWFGARGAVDRAAAATEEQLAAGEDASEPIHCSFTHSREYPGK